MKSLEVFQPQPNFPNEDLLESNAMYVSHLLRHEQSDRSLAQHFEPTLRPLHATGHQALQLCGVELKYSKDEYDAFCSGFAAHEYTATVVAQKPYNIEVATVKAKQLLVENPFMSDVEIAERFTAWRENHPTTHGVIIDAGAERDETMNQLQARAIGAAIARELQVL